MPEFTTGRQLTGDDIISELIRNVESGVFKVRYTALVPCIFNVYLHSSDYEQVRPIEEFVRGEAKAALNDHLTKLNKASGPAIARWLGIGGGQQVEFKKLEPDWALEFHPDAEDRLRPGDIEVYSELGTGQRAEFGSGAMTTFITRKPVERPAEQTEESAAPGTSRTDRQVHGYLRYEDSSGGKTFPITRDQTVIGRGGKAFWVDLKLEGPADISREHCRIRRDPATGSFFIKDLSQYGTTVDGAAIPSSLERSPQGEKVDRNVELPLPARARIGLAGVFDLEFEAAQAQ
jgi:hypothetical protein